LEDRIRKTVIDALKKIPYMRDIILYLYRKIGLFIQLPGKKNTTIFSFKNSFVEETYLQTTKINQKKSLLKDRMEEIMAYTEKHIGSLILHYLLNGTPNTNNYRYNMLLPFERFGTSEEKLKNAYEAASFMYINRLMLRYHKYKIGYDVMKIIHRYLRTTDSDIKVLDYGCGVADPSIYMALNGMDVTIVDLSNSQLEFAKWRFEKRNLPFRYVAAMQTEVPVELDNTFQVIVLAEFLEHTRNPRLFLEFAISHLEQGGILYDSLGPCYSHGVGGDHLKEAKDQMEQTDYQNYFNQNLISVNSKFHTDEFNHFYIKK